MNNEKYELWDKFLKRWSYERLKDMTLEEYTNIKEENDDYFCYWLESKTDKLGSVWGGSAFKFGIYRRKNGEEKEDSMGRMYSDKYAWLQKYGENKQGAFKKVKDKILKIIEYIQKGELKNIEDVDLGDAIKWKIAFLYQDRNNPKVVPIFKKEILEYLCGVSGSNISELYAKLMDEKPESEDIFEYAERLMKEFISRNPPNTGSKSNNGGGTIPKEIKEIKEMDKILENKKQTILYGVPGTGKTYLANKYIKEKTSNGKNNSEFTTFHQSYSYEDFIEGYRPKNDENGNINYEVEDGIFKKMCILAIGEALKNKENDGNIISNIDFDTLIEKFKEKHPIGSKLKTKNGKHFEISNYGSNAIDIKPLNGGQEYTLLIKKLEEFYNDQDVTRPSDIKYTNPTYYYSISKELRHIDNGLNNNTKNENLTYEEIKQKVIHAIKNKELTKEDFKNAPKYYLIIDEINRGNISNVLGELLSR
jgi:5-methylcytosine-specific restriction protein B